MVRLIMGANPPESLAAGGEAFMRENGSTRFADSGRASPRRFREGSDWSDEYRIRSCDDRAARSADEAGNDGQQCTSPPMPALQLVESLAQHPALVGAGGQRL